jgi:hypothetical protein
MYDELKEITKTVEGVRTLSKEYMYYAWKWYEEGSLQLSDEVKSELAYLMCLNGM